jgi:hypothetical protein
MVDSCVYIVNNKTDILDITEILLKVALNKIHKYINFRENEETIKNGQSRETGNISVLFWIKHKNNSFCKMK